MTGLFTHASLNLRLGYLCTLLIIYIYIYQAAVVSILVYRGTTWTLTKHIEKNLDGNYIRMIRAILNKSWNQHPTKQQIYSH